MDESRIPFTMRARVAPDADGGNVPDAAAAPIPADWVRIPVTIQVTIPAEMLQEAAGARAS